MNLKTVHNVRDSSKLPLDPLDVELKLEQICLTDGEKEEECHQVLYTATEPEQRNRRLNSLHNPPCIINSIVHLKKKKIQTCVLAKDHKSTLLRESESKVN